ncbi:senescence-associated protein, putative, partial [Medicago truncatula]
MWVGRDESKRQGLNLSGSWQQGHSALTIPRRVFKSSAHPPYAVHQRHVPLGGQGPLLLVGKRTTGTRIASSPDSDLEAFSHNPTHGSFAPLAFQPSAMTNCGKTNLSHDGLNPAHIPCWWVNNPTLGEFCFTMIGIADIEGSKSNVAMNAWMPQASYPCGNFSDTSSFKFRRSKGSIGHAFTVGIRTGNQNQTSFYPFVPHEISVLVKLILGHLRYLLTDVPPQPNSPPDNVFRPDRPTKVGLGSKKRGSAPPPIHGIIGLESSSTGSSFPADSAKPVPLAVVSLDSRQGQWESQDQKVPFPVRPPTGTRRPALAAGAAQAVRQQPTGSKLGPPCPALRANPFPEYDRAWKTLGPPDFQGPPGAHRTPRDVRCSSSRWTLPPAEPFPGNFNPIPLSVYALRGAIRRASPGPLGSTNPCARAVHMEPFPFFGPFQFSFEYWLPTPIIWPEEPFCAGSSPPDLSPPAGPSFLLRRWPLPRVPRLWSPCPCPHSTPGVFVALFLPCFLLFVLSLGRVAPPDLRSHHERYKTHVGRRALNLMASGATCVQRLDGSRDSAIHTKYRISLRSSSMQEPRYPLPRVILYNVSKHNTHENRLRCHAGIDNDPSAGSPTETLLRLLLPLNDKVQWTSHNVAGSGPPTSPQSEHFTGPFNRQIAPPTKNGHAPPPIESRKSSQSVNPYYVWTCGVLKATSADPWSASFMVETRTLFVFHKSKNFTSDYEIRMPPTVPVNHYSDPEGQHNRIRIL